MFQRLILLATPLAAWDAIGARNSSDGTAFSGSLLADVKLVVLRRPIQVRRAPGAHQCHGLVYHRDMRRSAVKQASQAFGPGAIGPCPQFDCASG